MKTTYTYDHYFLYEEMKNNLEQLEIKYSNIMSLAIIGITPKHRNLYAVTISNGSDETKPALYIDGNTHAGEVTGSMAALHTIDYLVTNYKKDDKVTNIIDNYTIYVIPRISPDGSEVYLSTANKLRSVDRIYPDLTDKGLHDQDIDNDGVLRMMRVKTAYGAWKKHPDNEDLMLKRLPDDIDGDFYNVYPEGVIKEYDGIHINIAKPTWGLDFNRNYPFGWFSEVRQPGSGPYPLSNMENKAVVDFVLNHKNISGVLTHHTFGGMILCPPGTRPESSSSKHDQKILREIGKMATETMGYPLVMIFDAFMEDQEFYSSGAFDDWCYQQMGIPAYTTELWNMVSRAGIEQKWPAPKKDDITLANEYQLILKWCHENAPESIKKWTKCNHPQLGDVEIGGIDMKFTLQNPPTKFLKQEVEKTTLFSLRMVLTLPKLSFEKIVKSKIDNNTYELTVLVANTGYLPTYLTTETKKMNLESMVQVSVSSDSATVIGHNHIELGSLEGFSGVETSYYYDHSINTYNYQPIVKKATFIVTGKQGDVVEVKAACDKAGVIYNKIIL